VRVYGALNRLAGVLGASRLFEGYGLPREEHRTLDQCSTIGATLRVESNTAHPTVASQTRPCDARGGKGIVRRFSVILAQLSLLGEVSDVSVVHPQKRESDQR
jgi:hypothetical protein